MPAVMRLSQENHLRDQAVPVIVDRITRRKTRKKNNRMSRPQVYKETEEAPGQEAVPPEYVKRIKKRPHLLVSRARCLE